MTDFIEVIEPGLLTTVQDLGRYGYMRYGVPTAGAMDPYALRVANILVGNPEDVACLEMTITGPKLRFLSDALISITGADMGPTLNGNPMHTWRSVLAPQGGTLSFERLKEGSRAYLALAGGIDVPKVMDSRSTYLKAGFGGLGGRAMAAGDTLSTSTLSPPLDLEGRRASQPSYPHDLELRVILGPQSDAFTSGGLETFLSSTFAITPLSDRMGYRLKGPKIEHKSTPDIVSDGIALGGVQVAGDGQPIVLMADRGTSGGYTKIATIISVDVGRLAQSIPGDKVRFKAVEIEEAHRALRDQEEALARVRRLVSTSPSHSAFRLNLDGASFKISVSVSQDGDTGASGRVVVNDDFSGAFTFDVEVQPERKGA